jgi:hypothetical protein
VTGSGTSNEEAAQADAANSSQSTQGAQQAAESVMEVPIGGWPMEEVFGASGEDTDPDVRRGLETFWAILGIARANAAEIETEEAPSQSVQSRAECIWVSSRNVVGTGTFARHASLTFMNSYPWNWFSAYDSDPHWWSDGLLVSEKGEPSDHHYYTMAVALVFPASGLPCNVIADQAYWQQLLSAEDNYDGLLPYNKFGGPPGYNSNGFVHGILLATGGGTGGLPPANLLFGWNNPVPASEFQ